VRACLHRRGCKRQRYRTPRSRCGPCRSQPWRHPRRLETGPARAIPLSPGHAHRRARGTRRQLPQPVRPNRHLQFWWAVVTHIMGALAEFERALIVERTQAGIQTAKKRGVHLGRRPSLAPAQVDHARALIERRESPRAVARTMRVGKSTLYRAPKTTNGRTPLRTGRGARQDPLPACPLRL
jgi:hypothetical protein